MPLLKQFEKAFGKTKIPQILQDFIAFAEKQDDFFAGDFELDPSSKAIIDTYDDYDKKKKEKFFSLGNNGDGSSFMIWQYNGKVALEQSPITFWDSEGQSNIVVASNLKEFLSIIATDGSFSSGSFTALEEDEDPSRGNKAFKKWLKEKYKLAPVKNPNQLIIKAHEAFPTIDDWFAGKVDTSTKSTNKKTTTAKPFTSWAHYFKNNPKWFNIIGKNIEIYLPMDQLSHSSQGETYTYTIPSEGIKINTTLDKIIKCIKLVIKQDKYNKYVYKNLLPETLQSKMNKKEIIDLLGKPTEQTDYNGIIYKEMDKYIVYIQLTKEEKISEILLYEPISYLKKFPIKIQKK